MPVNGLVDKFSARAAAVRKQSPLDARLVPALCFAAALFIADAWYISATDLVFRTHLILALFGSLVFMLIGGMLARHYGLTRVGDAIQAFAFLPIFSALGVAGMVILTRYSMPFADDVLSGADRAMGLDWMAMFAFFQHRPALIEVGRIAYFSFFWQSMAISLILFAFNRTSKGWRFVNAVAITLIVSVLIYPFFTAEGPYLQYGIVPADIPTLNSDAPWITGKIIEAIRTGRDTDVIGSWTGLIFFPSVHAADAAIYIWAWWEMRWLRWPMLALNLVLIAVTPLFGLHYFIDVLGGLCVGCIGIVLSGKLTGAIEARLDRYDAGLAPA